MPSSLYLHVPFCPKICPYCDFHKMRRNEALVESYLKRLEREARSLYAEFPSQLNTLYFGGGTPSHLSNNELERIIASLAATWGWPAKLETTLEADPLTFDKTRLGVFKAMGFSRLSIGFQSSQDEVLAFLGRRHTGNEGLKALDWALDAGFEVSADLITGIDVQDTQKDLLSLAKTGVPHISVYSLTIEPFTPFGLRKLQLDEDKEADDYELTHRVLQTYGLERYEVSSHAKPGHESKHNQVYWQGEHFLALGPSAAGFVPKPGYLGERRTNRSIKTWLLDAPPDRLELNAQDYLIDCLMTGLRTRQGVDTVQLEHKTGIKVLEVLAEPLRNLAKLELLELHKTYLRATPKGFLQLNGLIRRLVHDL